VQLHLHLKTAVSLEPQQPFYLAHPVHIPVHLARLVRTLKLEFMGPTRTSSPTNARGCRQLLRPACHEPDTHDDPRRLVRHARFSSRGCPLGMRACTRVFTAFPGWISNKLKLHDRRIPNVGVRVRVGPVECQLLPGTRTRGRHAWISRQLAAYCVWVYWSPLMMATCRSVLSSQPWPIDRCIRVWPSWHIGCSGRLFTWPGEIIIAWVFCARV